MSESTQPKKLQSIQDDIDDGSAVSGRWINTRTSELYSNMSHQSSSLTVAGSPTDRFNTLHDYKSFLKTSVKEFHSKFSRSTVNRSLKIDDFELVTTVDFCTNGKIVMVVSKKDGHVYSLTCRNKELVIQNEAVDQIKNELRILMSVKFHFLLSSVDNFIDNSYIYSLMPFLSGGLLLNHIKYLGYFEERLALFCASQIALALEYLHGLKIAHRDIKPESVLMDYRGYVKLGNFTFSKIINERTFSLCGTPAYVAPEILVQKGHSLTVDWWSFGAFIYEMCSGHPPFSANTFDKTYEQILKGRFRMKEWFSNELRDLLVSLLTTDTTKRLGSSKNGVIDVKNHRWFADVNWLALLNKKSPSPYLPSLMSPVDPSLFGHLPEEPLFIEETDRFNEYFKDF